MEWDGMVEPIVMCRLKGFEMVVVFGFIFRVFVNCVVR